MKKPDQFVVSPASMPYPTNVGAPAFTVPDVLRDKNERGANAIHSLETKFEELKKEYFNRSALVPALTFVDEIRSMKALTHMCKDGE